MYSGSFGRAHSFTEILSIARQLRNVSAHFSFSIRGNRAAEVRKAVTPADHNISFASFVPVDQLEARLSAADIHVVSLRPEWTGTVVPCKFFGALAAGRPVLFTGSEDCSIARLIRHHGVGWVCSPGKESEVAQQLRLIAKEPESLLALKKHCHRVYWQNFSREAAIEGFDQDLRNLIPFPH
jgi:glycosyltransferase involved in cell wall biosynthesis